ncbi:hypothetical protein JW868_01980 [Candidatus Woesearchaeota archaeon]|nr:hypothetical protein [Candidatus Woesearchaeota archaeon]
MNIRHALLTGLAALVAGTTTPRNIESAQVQTADEPKTELKLGGDFQYNNGSEVMRLHSAYGPLRLDTRTMSIESLDEKTTDNQAVSALSTIAGTFWGRVKDFESSNTRTGTLGYSNVLEGQFIMPLWLTFDENGKMLSNCPYASGSVGNLEFAAEYDINNGAKDQYAGFIVLNRQNDAFMVGKHFDDQLRTAYSSTFDGHGMLGDMQYNPDNGDFTGALTLSQQAYGTASKLGAKTTGDTFVIGILAERAPYLSATANKIAEQGFSCKAIVEHSGDDTVWTSDLGYQSNGLGYTIRAVMDGEEITPALFVTKRLPGGMFLEAKLGDDGLERVYASYSAEF